MDNCETQDLPVKKRIAAAVRNGKTGAFGDTINPIDQEIKNLKDSRLISSKYPIIPFFDNGDATLRFMQKMADLSPTQGSCISSKASYVLGGELTVIRSKRSGFQRLRPKEVTESEFFLFSDFLEMMNPGFDGTKLLEEIEGTYKNYETNGNGWVILTLTEVAGSKFAYIENKDSEKVYYMPLENPYFILTANEWTETYLNEYPPEIIGVYPKITEFENGVRKTAIHIKNKAVNRDWYGLPASIQSLYYQYMEVQLGQYNIEGYAADWIPRALIEVSGEIEDEEGETGKDDFDEAIKNTFTNVAREKKRVVIRRRDADATEAFVHEFRPNADHISHKENSELCEKQIIKSHNWHSILLGQSTPGKLGASKEFLEVYENKFVNVIRPLQKKIMQPYNTLLKCVMEHLDFKGLEDLSLDLANLHEKALQEYRDTKQGKQEETS